MKLTRTDVITIAGVTETRIKTMQINDFDIGVSITSKITQKGGILAGTGAGVIAEFPPGSNGQVLSYDDTEVTGLKAVAPTEQGGATLTNKSGGDVTTGAVVIQYTSTASCFTTTTVAADSRVIGVVAENIADNAEGKVLIKGGVGTIMVTGTVAIGDKLCSSTSAQRARKALIGEWAFATAVTANASGNGTVTGILNYPPPPQYKLLGYDALTATHGSTAGYLWLYKFTADKNGIMTEFRVKAHGTGNVKCAFYNDNAGAPGALVTYTASTAVVLGWNSIASLAEIPVIQGTDYWLAYTLDDDDAVGRVSDATASGSYVAMTYADPFPNPPTGLSTGSTYRCLIAGWG